MPENSSAPQTHRPIALLGPRLAVGGRRKPTSVTVTSSPKTRFKTLASSCSGPNEKSVSINVRFNKKATQAEGQYVVVAGSKYENKEIARIIRGEWESITEEEKEKRGRIAQLLAYLNYAALWL